MNWSKYISENELEQLSKKIQLFESKSSVEIVTVIADRSSTTRHLKFTLFLLLSVITIVCIYSFNLAGQYNITPVYFIGLHLLNLILSFILSQSYFLQRLFIPKDDRLFQVECMAEREFYVQRIHMTRSKTGLLIYVSLMEKQVIILADDAIAKKFPSNTWNDIVNTITNEVHKTDLYHGLSKGFDKCELRLNENFPIENNDTNELPNHIILREHP